MPDTPTAARVDTSTRERELDVPTELSIVVPFFNEEANLEQLMTEITAALQNFATRYEVILVDDGSADDGARIARRLATRDDRVRLLRLRRNRGQSAAIAAGIDHAKAPVLVTLDADLQNDPADIPRVLEALAGWDVVSGVRRVRRDSWVRRLSSRIANRVRARVLGDSITDVGCSLKAYRTDFVRGLPLFDGAHRFLPALALLKGARIRELDVNHRPRRAGTSKYGIGNRLGRGIVDLMGVRWLQRRWIDRAEAIEESAEPTGHHEGAKRK